MLVSIDWRQVVRLYLMLLSFGLTIGCLSVAAVLALADQWYPDRILELLTWKLQMYSVLALVLLLIVAGGHFARAWLQCYVQPLLLRGRSAGRRIKVKLRQIVH